MSVKAVAWALDRDVENTPGLDATAKLVLLELAEAAAKSDDCAWIGKPELARAALVRSIRTADKWVNWLISAGLIEQLTVDDLPPERRAEYLSLPSGKRPNIYRICWRTPAKSAGVTPATAVAPPQGGSTPAITPAMTPAMTPATAVAGKPLNQEPVEPPVVDQLAALRRLREKATGS